MTKIRVTGYVPKEVLNIDAVRLQLLNALRAEGRAMRQDFWKTTASWKHKPKFEIRVSLKKTATSGESGVEVYTSDEVYGWVCGGTGTYVGKGKYPIRPKKIRRDARGRFRKTAKRLLFRTGYVPKTRPGVLGSGKGGAEGPYRSPKEVMHPGIKPRRFDEKVMENSEKNGRFQKRIDAAIEAGMKKATSVGKVKIG